MHTIPVQGCSIVFQICAGDIDVMHASIECKLKPVTHDVHIKLLLNEWNVAAAQLQDTLDVLQPSEHHI